MLSLFLLPIILSPAGANIIFPFVQPTCSFDSVHQGCLRGQRCLPDDTCISTDLRPSLNSPISSNPPRHLQRRERRGTTARLSSNTEPNDNEPVIVPVIGEVSRASSAGSPVTTDGTCGASNGRTVCGNWSQGSCCSMYGFCGNTAAHCGQGCQSGPCEQAPVEPAPGPSSAPMNANPGTFDIVGESGVPAMHAALLPNGRVVFLDKIENYTQLTLPDGYYAYSSEYDPDTNQVVPLGYKTNAFCAGGSFLANGTLLSVGGNGPLTWLDPTVGDGFSGERYLTRSSSDASLDGQSWVEPGNTLNTPRWYPSVQTMPDGTLFVASGSLNGLDPTKPSNNNPTYEILNPDGTSQGQSIPMALLEKSQPYYMYPFLHLLPDGSLFVFTSRSAQLFDATHNTPIATLPDLPGEYRTYPNTGGSVLLPLSAANAWSPEVMVCGGGAYQDITSPTDASCGRIAPLAPNPSWAMDDPLPSSGRGMVEGTLLPDGTVLWVNGAGQGAQGFGLARDPTLDALIYDPGAPVGARWTRGASSAIPRLYHSVALLLLDGTLLIAGSNPVQMPVLVPDAENPYVTEFRVERYTPSYLAGPDAEGKRPVRVRLGSTEWRADGTSKVEIAFELPALAIATAAEGESKGLQVALYHGGFVTHSLHMGHRMLFLDTEGFRPGEAQQTVTVTMPPNGNVAPPGPYVVYVVVNGVPAMGQFVMVS